MIIGLCSASEIILATSIASEDSFKVIRLDVIGQMDVTSVGSRSWNTSFGTVFALPFGNIGVLGCDVAS